MILSIMQPAYLPWLGYFDRIRRSDMHVVLDHVQIDRNSKTKFANRNKIRTASGWSWLTVPLKAEGSLRINEIEISPDIRWARKHYEAIRHAYRRASHFSEQEPFLRELYEREWTHLAPLLDVSTGYLLRALRIDTPRVTSSSLGVEGAKSDLILNICVRMGASCYLSGPFGRSYLDTAAFEAAGIEVRFHDYEHPRYQQAYPGFEPFMSALDLLLNCGDGSADVLASAGDGAEGRAP